MRAEIGVIVACRFLKDGPHGIHAEPSHLHIEGSTCLPECHDKGTKRSPAEAEYGRGLHRVDAKAEVQATPTGIKAGVSRNVWTDYYSVLTHRLCAGSNVGRCNRTEREC